MRKIDFGKLVVLFATTVFGLSATSCSDNSEDEKIISDETVVNSNDDAIAVTAGAYATWSRFSSGYSFIVESATSGTVSFEGEEDAAGPTISRLELEPTNSYFTGVWARNTQAIAAANDAISKITAAQGVDAATKKLTIARNKLIRGLAYSYLVQLFGEVPLNLTPGVEVTTRSSIDAVYTQIVKDLEEAAADLPAADATISNPSKGTAWALLSRVYLAWGNNPLSQSQVQAIVNSRQDPAVSYNTSRLEKAVEYADKVINSRVYKLQPNYDDIWGTGNETKGPEKILTFVKDGDAAGSGNHQTHCSFTFAFDVQKDNHIGPSNHDLWKNWPEGDVRREWSYTSHLVNAETGKDVSFLPPVTLPRFGKYIDHTYENSYNICITKNDLDRVELRYAEVLLNKAEALVELGRDNATATALVNQLQERAFGNDQHNYASVTLDDIKQEWAYEFTYEQKSWFNLVRWKQLIADVLSVENLTYFDQANVDAISEQGGDNAAVQFFQKVHKHLHAKYDKISGKYYRFPIPTGQSGEDLGITPQNPGY